MDADILPTAESLKMLMGIITKYNCCGFKIILKKDYF